VPKWNSRYNSHCVSFTHKHTFIVYLDKVVSVLAIYNIHGRVEVLTKPWKTAREMQQNLSRFDLQGWNLVLPPVIKVTLVHPTQGQNDLAAHQIRAWNLILSEAQTRKSDGGAPATNSTSRVSNELGLELHVGKIPENETGAQNSRGVTGAPTVSADRVWRRRILVILPQTHQ